VFSGKRCTFCIFFLCDYIYLCKTFIAQAAIEYALLADIHKNIESQYQSDRPPHHQPNATMQEYRPEASQFFVTTAEIFGKLGGEDIQEIFRHRHIVISGSSSEGLRFDHHGLASLGSLDAFREIQGRKFVAKSFV
jgi:hypothetical protein